MCTVLLPPGGNPIAVKYIRSYHVFFHLMLVNTNNRNRKENIESTNVRSPCVVLVWTVLLIVSLLKTTGYAILPPPPHFSIYVYTRAAIRRVFKNCVAFLWVELPSPSLKCPRLVSYSIARVRAYVLLLGEWLGA
jgi:hypothetical protein